MDHDGNPARFGILLAVEEDLNRHTAHDRFVDQHGGQGRDHTFSHEDIVETHNGKILPDPPAKMIGGNHGVNGDKIIGSYQGGQVRMLKQQGASRIDRIFSPAVAVRKKAFLDLALAQRPTVSAAPLRKTGEAGFRTADKTDFAMAFFDQVLCRQEGAMFVIGDDRIVFAAIRVCSPPVRRVYQPV